MDTRILAMTEIDSFKNGFMGKVIVLKSKGPDTGRKEDSEFFF